MDIGYVAASDVTNCTENAEITGIVVTSGNVHVSKSEGGALHIEMNGGHLNGHYIMSSVSFSNCHKFRMPR